MLRWSFALFVLLQDAPQVRRVYIEWKSGKPEGRITGKLDGLKITRGQGVIQESDDFACTQGEPFQLEITGRGLITVTTRTHPFSFFIEDVSKDFPILIPDYGLVVTTDGRSYADVETSNRAKRLKTNLQRIQDEPEESFENASKHAKRMSCQTWLGMSRDIRIFSFGEKLDWFAPRLPTRELTRYTFYLGRGHGAVEGIQRRLENGILPILRGSVTDEDVIYDLTAFVTIEKLVGTHYLVSDGHSAGFMFTPAQKAKYDALMAEPKPADETILMIRVQARNTGAVPRHAFFKAPTSRKVSGKIAMVIRQDGKPLAADESATLLQPGATTTFELAVPHKPVETMPELSFDERLAACRAFWTKKLDAAAKIRLPETRLTEMIQAGLLHLDLICYGLEPEGTLNPTIGVYTAIGSESAPIIQFFDSMGRHDLARRALQFFLDKQHDNGFMQNFGGYMLETGAVLWSLGEHYRYTKDDAWVKQIAPKVIKACEYLRAWRHRNLKEELRGKGYGMLEGKVADPEDPYHVFMLNGYAYLGLARAAEMLRSDEWRREAEALRADIRASFFASMGRSPVMPLGDGTWGPTAPPWPEYAGPVALYADAGRWYSHGTFMIRDSALGPLYLAFQEVLDPSEAASTYLLNMHQELMTKRNVAFSQPYYSRHPWVHLKRGEVKPFLKTYYTAMASLADRETYTFWEHYYGVSPHKTHEEAWFLMETRWMLYMERGETLELLPGAPETFFEPGKTIEIKGAKTYFGPLNLKVEAKTNKIEATIECPGAKSISIRGRRIENFTGRATLVIER
jgi:hypothetical protein